MISEPDILLLQKGDPDEWDKAFKWLWPTAYAVSRYTLVAILPQQVEDNAIEAIEAVFEKVSSCKAMNEIRAMLARIARNLGVDCLRKHYSLKKGSGKVSSLNDEEHGEIPDSTILDLDSKLKQEDAAELIWKILDKLNEKERKCVVAFYLHSQSYKEISDKLGIPIGSVGVTIKRALKKMSDLLKKM